MQPLRAVGSASATGCSASTRSSPAVLLIPIVYTIVFSFNDSRRSRTSSGAGSPSTTGSTSATTQGVCAAFGNSILVGVIATLLATDPRHDDRDRARALPLPVPRSAISLLLFLPMATPEVVLGAGLAAQFLTAGVPKGIVHDHPRPHDVLHQLRRRHGAGARREPRPGARGGGSRPLRLARRRCSGGSRFPLLLPGIIAAALLSFALSFDDFIITNFNSGAVETFPKYVYTAAARGIPAEANVIASAVFLIAIVDRGHRADRARRRGASGSPESE